MNIKKILLLGIGWIISFLAMVILIAAITKTATPKDFLRLLKTRRTTISEKKSANTATLTQQKQRFSKSTGLVTQTNNPITNRQQNVMPKKSLKLNILQKEKKPAEGKDPEQSLIKQKLLHQLEAQRKKRINNLVRLYNSMDPREVVSIMDSLSDETVVEILSRMRTRQAAKVLSGLPPGRAAQITRLITQGKNCNDNRTGT